MEKATDTITADEWERARPPNCSDCLFYKPHPKQGESIEGGLCKVVRNPYQKKGMREGPRVVLATDWCDRFKGGSKRF